MVFWLVIALVLLVFGFTTAFKFLLLLALAALVAGLFTGYRRY